MIVFLFTALFAFDNKEFLEMVEQKQNEGCSWHYVGRTEVTDELALPIILDDGTEIYYWHICE